MTCYCNVCNAIRRRYGAASADTHPKDGDVKQAPLESGAVPKADAQMTFGNAQKASG